MPPAGAGDTPEASGDSSSGTLGKMSILFKRNPSEDNAWCHTHSIAEDPSGIGSITFQVARDCSPPTDAHSSFIKSFLAFYPSLWPGIRSKLIEVNTELKQEGDIKDLSEGVDLYLPADFAAPLQWSMQYSFQSPRFTSFGVFIEFVDQQIIEAYGTD